MPYVFQRIHLNLLAERCEGTRKISDKEQKLYDSIDAEIARIKLGVEFGHLAWRLRD